MHLTDEDFTQLRQYLQRSSAPPTAFFGADRQILMETGVEPERAEKLIRTYFLVHRQPVRYSDENHTIFPCGSDEAPLFCLVMQPNAVQTEAFVRSALELMDRSKREQALRRHINLHALLTNQIANQTAMDSGPRRIVDALGISIKANRQAILCSFESDSPTAIGTDFRHNEQQISRCLADAVTQSPWYTANDIYGSLSPNHFLIFKEVQISSPIARREYLTRVAEDLVSVLMQTARLSLTVAIGSSYNELSDLGQSYREALFLLDNYEYLNVKCASCLFIEDYLFEYFASLVPEQETARIFSLQCEMLEQKKRLSPNVMALTRSSNNLSASASQLGLHRNTMLQRYNSLRSHLGLDPLYRDRDRLAMRSLALYLNRTITWHVGIVIPNHSVLHEGMQHFAELVHSLSGGAMKIIIHTLANSGDNDALFSYVCSGSIDGMVGNTSALYGATNGLSAALDLPFLFDSDAQAEHILNTVAVEAFAPYLSAVGAICPNIWSMGWRYITSRDSALRTPRDLAGKKVRIMFTEQLPAYFKAIGAVPVKLYYNDVNASLASGLVDCQENPYTNILGMRFYRHQDHVCELNFHLSTDALIFSKRSWERLPPALQSCVKQAAGEATAWAYRRQRLLNEQSKQMLVSRKRMKIIRPTDAEEQLWRDKAAPLYTRFQYPEFLETILRKKDEFNAQRKEEQPV